MVITLRVKESFIYLCNLLLVGCYGVFRPSSIHYCRPLHLSKSSRRIAEIRSAAQAWTGGETAAEENCEAMESSACRHVLGPASSKSR
jgi:hypothetical protein